MLTIVHFYHNVKKYSRLYGKFGNRKKAVSGLLSADRKNYLSNLAFPEISSIWTFHTAVTGKLFSTAG